MNVSRHVWFWLAVLVVFTLALYKLGSVLTPFVAAFAVAYLLDPVVGRLQRARMSRGTATAIVTLGFCLIVVLVMVLLAPVLIGQLIGFAKRLPSYLDVLREKVPPLIDSVRDLVPADLIERLQSAAVDYAGPAAKSLAGVVAGLIGGSLVLIDLLSLAIITPVVAFYVLRDWPRLLARIDEWMPIRHAATIRAQLALVDRTLAGFLRGQATVCVLLGLMYGIGLSLVGLDFGLAVGLFTGLVSFIPYFGMGIGLVLSLALALIQFATWHKIALVVMVFMLGQVVESYFLTPRLVGDRVGLHPVWIMFALLAGGALFGFVGILLAVPVAAVIGVGVRFVLARYLESTFYHGREVDAAVAAGDDLGRTT
jgi:predicted PurR-regulated permease PerM